MANRWGKKWKQWQTLFSWAPKVTADGDFTHEIKRCLLLGRKAVTNLDSVLKGRGITLLRMVHFVKTGFSGSHVWMWELDHKEVWTLKNWCFQTVVLEKTLKSPLDCKEIKALDPNGNQSRIFIGRTVGEAEALILWPPDVKNDSLERTLLLGW